VNRLKGCVIGQKVCNGEWICDWVYFRLMVFSGGVGGVGGLWVCAEYKSSPTSALLWSSISGPWNPPIVKKLQTSYLSASLTKVTIKKLAHDKKTIVKCYKI
jgi:hypothetical protein